jgi:hypothetical protein
MTKDELKAAFNVYTEQIQKLTAAQIHWALIHYIIIFPDICSALEANDGESTGNNYKDWATRYLADGDLSAEEWWDIRNLLLHQGRTIGRKRYINYQFRSPDANGQTTHKHISQNIIVLDATELAKEVELGLEKWFGDIENQVDPTKAANVEKNIPKLAGIVILPIASQPHVRSLFQTPPSAFPTISGISATGSYSQTTITPLPQIPPIGKKK